MSFDNLKDIVLLDENRIVSNIDWNPLQSLEVSQKRESSERSSDSTTKAINLDLTKAKKLHEESISTFSPLERWETARNKTSQLESLHFSGFIKT